MTLLQRITAIVKHYKDDHEQEHDIVPLPVKKYPVLEMRASEKQATATRAAR